MENLILELKELGYNVQVMESPTDLSVWTGQKNYLLWGGGGEFHFNEECEAIAYLQENLKDVKKRHFESRISHSPIYLGYGCASAVISGNKLIVDCWRTTTSMVVSNLYCDAMKGVVTLTKQTTQDDETDVWKAYISPNTYFALDIQGQHDVIFFWDGVSVFEVAGAWFGGGESCFQVSYKGKAWNSDLRRKKTNIFKGIETPSQWADACKALQIVNFV
jgi:hypothetical protein